MKAEIPTQVFAGRILIIGLGSIAQGVLPLIFRHLRVRADQVEVVTADDDGDEVARAYGVSHTILPLTPDNLHEALTPRLAAGDFLFNLSVNVSSVALIAFCRDCGALYIDACIEPWAGGYIDASLTASQRTNYAMREQAKALHRPGAPTALLTHGANPGWVSHFVKQALLDIARDCGQTVTVPDSREGWAKLAQSLSIKTIHIAERDWQMGATQKRVGEFVNTWSVEGFVGEGSQPAELGWGSHEKYFPPDGHRHDFGCRAAIYLDRPGAATRVRTWTPLAGAMHGFLVTHGESISIANFLTVGSGDSPAYRPTVHYAYHPSDATIMSMHELIGNEWRPQAKSRIMREEIISGVDELGVLLLGHAKGAYWLGSRLSSDEARQLVPYNSATILQVTAGVIAGAMWAIRNPDRGVVDPEELPFDEIIKLCRPYLGKIVGEYADWTPLKNRADFFPQDIDPDDPWQFRNFRVI